MKLIAAIGKQLFDLRRADTKVRCAARLRVGGIEPEVIRKDHAAGFENTLHIRTDIMAEVGIKNGGDGSSPPSPAELTIRNAHSIIQ